MSRLLQRLPCSLVEHSRASQKTLDALQHDFALYLDYVSEAEQDALVAESRHALKKMDWSDDHFDSVICKYREVVLKDLRRFPVLKSLLNEQIRPAFFTNPEQGLLEPHVLELAGDGHIRPHMDNYCGSTIVGVSLLSARVMRFRRADRHDDYFEVLLPPRSLYWQRARIRFEYEHEIEAGAGVSAGTRISLMFREQPPPAGGALADQRTKEESN